MQLGNGQQITVRNLQHKIPVKVQELEKFAAKALRACLRLHRHTPTKLMGLHEIFVLLISDRRMSSLHRQFLRQSGPTDVLTFEHGEIFISTETARQNARLFRTSLGRELRLYLVHGLLHLHGFDDQNEADAREMRKVQEKILRGLV